jgi:MFS transporter, DHA1 family, tetracycline resistance protein
MKRLLPLVLVVVVDLLGFGIIIPLFPFMGVRFGLSPAAITLILAAYSLCQLIAAPVWGGLSDRYGRRPILMSSMLGAALSYVMLAFGDTVFWLVASRIVGGLMAGNLSAAFAYAADVTSAEDRARGLGLVGAAIGLGFTLGPALGGLMAGADPHTASFTAPALTAAGLSLVAFVCVWLFLPESHSPQQTSAVSERRGRLDFAALAARPVLLKLVLATLLFTIAHAMLESILALWALDKFGFGPRQVGLLLLMIGGVLVLMQAGVVGWLTRRFAERRVAIGGILMYLAGLGLLAFTDSPALAVAGGLCCGIGAGVYNPSMSSLASKQAGPHERGVVMGTYQSSTSLARVIGPALSGTIYTAVALEAPFVLGMAILVPAIWLILNARAAVSSRELSSSG